ncbi:esa1-associated factor [Saitoella coloradoensis]
MSTQESIESKDEVMLDAQLDTVAEDADEWTADEEIELLRQVCRYRPVGIHKHFRMVSIAKSLNGTAADARYPIKRIWAKLATLYDLQKLDELDAVNPDTPDASGATTPATNAPDVIPDTPYTEFTLPVVEYGYLMLRHAKGQDDDGMSLATSPAQLSNYTFTSKGRKQGGSVGTGTVASEDEEEETGSEEEEEEEEGSTTTSPARKRGRGRGGARGGRGRRKTLGTEDDAPEDTPTKPARGRGRGRGGRGRAAASAGTRSSTRSTKK